MKRTCDAVGNGRSSEFSANSCRNVDGDDSDYFSDSSFENYYLNYEEEQKPIKLLDHFSVSACELSWNLQYHNNLSKRTKNYVEEDCRKISPVKRRRRSTSIFSSCGASTCHSLKPQTSQTLVSNDQKNPAVDVDANLVQEIINGEVLVNQEQEPRKVKNQELGWNISVNMNEIEKKPAITDRRIKGMSSLCRANYHNNLSKKTKNCAEEYRRKRSSVKTGASTSYSPCTQTSQTLVVDNANPVQEINNGAVLMNQEQVGLIGGGEASVLVIRRQLKKTDMSDHQHRLSMPCNQVINHNFLTREESKKLCNNCSTPTKLLTPNGRTYDAHLKLMQAGPSSYCYAIGKPWNQIKRENGFQTGMVLDVRAFRRDGGQLCFILEIVNTNNNNIC